MDNLNRQIKQKKFMMARTKQNKQVPDVDQASTAGEDWESEMGTATGTNNSAVPTPSFIANDAGVEDTQEMFLRYLRITAEATSAQEPTGVDLTQVGVRAG